MKRINLDTINQLNGLYMHHGEPFSGIGFILGEGRGVKSFQFKNGSLVGTYNPLCAPNSLGLTQLDVTGLLSEDENSKEPLKDSDGAFSGIGYEFQNGYCVHELLFDRGTVVCDCWWLKTGILVGYNLISGIHYHYDWYSSGALKSASVSYGELFSGLFGFHDDGKLRSLTLHGDFFSNLPKIIDETSFFPIKDKEDIALFRGASSLYLSRNCIDDGVVELMANSGLFDETGTLKFNDTKISNITIPILSKLKNLKALTIESEDELQSDIADTVKKRRPDIDVRFILVSRPCATKQKPTLGD